MTLRSAPLLISESRGEENQTRPFIECTHHGLVYICDGEGKTIFSLGDSDSKLHMRSTAKPFQILPLINSLNGSLEEFSHREIALMISSHGGERHHVETATNIAQKFSLTQNDFVCGIHRPLEDDAFLDLVRNNQLPSVFHHNCCGNHLALLIAALKKNLSVKNYFQDDHPVQQEIKNYLAEISKVNAKDIETGTDGCSIPSFIVPIKNIALLYARLSYWQVNNSNSQNSFFSQAFKLIFSSATACPDYVAGEKKFDTVLMKAGQKNIFCKYGANGVLALSVLPSQQFQKGLGIVIKIADGDVRQNIRPLIALHLLDQLNILPKNFWDSDTLLSNFADKSVRNTRAEAVGKYILDPGLNL